MKIKSLNKSKSVYKSILKAPLLVASITLIYNLCFFNRYFPISEGWYTSLGTLLNQGQVLYRDIPWVFPPIYPYFISTFMAIFGSNFILLRILGVGIMIGIMLSVFYILNHFFDDKVSAIGTLAILPLYTSEPIFIAYDYYPFYILLALWSCVCFLKAMRRFFIKDYSRYFLWMFAAGILASLAIFTRQNSGFFTMVFPFFAWMLIVWKRFGIKSVVRAAFPYLIAILGVTFVVGFLLYLAGALIPFIHNSILDVAEAKGGVQGALLNWIFRLSWKRAVRYAFLTGIFGLLMPWYVLEGKKSLKSYFLRHSFTRKIKVSFRNYMPCLYRHLHNKSYLLLFSATLISMSGFFLLQLKPFKPLFRIEGLNALSVGFTLAVIILLLVALFNQRVQKIFFSRVHINTSALLVVLSFSFGLIWGVGTSAGVTPGAAFLSLSFFFAYLLKNAKFESLFFWGFFFILIMSPYFYFSQQKAQLPYSWWGLSSAPIRLAVFQPNFPSFRGIYTSVENKYLLEKVTSLIQEYSSPEESIMLYPQIPIFYFLANRKPATHTLVQWFDVSLPSWIEADIERLKNNLPAVFVLDDFSEYIYQGHEQLFNNAQPCAQRKMYQAIKQIISTHSYKLVGEFPIRGGHKLKVFVANSQKR